MATARDWILVLFGRFIRVRGGWVPVRLLTQLLEPLGVDSPSVRTAISRMKRADFVEPAERLGVAGYQLTREGEAFFTDGDRRVLERRFDEEGWVLASFSVPEAERTVRYKIRARLTDLGFGQESAGLLVAPAGLAAEAERSLRREGLDAWVSLWMADFGSLGSLSDVVARSWDLPSLAAAYEGYIDHAAGALRSGWDDDDDAFVRYLPLVNDWRALQYLDPGLPAHALPLAWPQPEALALFDEIETKLFPAARRSFDARYRLCIGVDERTPVGVVPGASTAGHR